MVDSTAPVSFSVIVPAYNAHSTIGRAIESILTQSFPALEVIVVDDGSTDETADAVARFGSPVRCHRQANAGVSAARNAGAKFATGEWLTFLDADDWYYPDRLRWHAELLRRHPDLEILSGDYEFWPNDGGVPERSMQTLGFGRELLSATDHAVELVLERQQLTRFIIEYFGCTLTFSIRRRLFDELGGFPVGFPVAEDLHLFVRACARALRLGVVTTPLAGYNIHHLSAVRHDRERAQREAVRALINLKKVLHNESPHIRYASRHLLRAARLDLATSVLRSRGRTAALKAVLPLLVEHPQLSTLRVLASLARG